MTHHTYGQVTPLKRQERLIYGEWLTVHTICTVYNTLYNSSIVSKAPLTLCTVHKYTSTYTMLHHKCFTLVKLLTRESALHTRSQYSAQYRLNYCKLCVFYWMLFYRFVQFPNIKVDLFCIFKDFPGTCHSSLCTLHIRHSNQSVPCIRVLQHR